MPSNSQTNIGIHCDQNNVLRVDFSLYLGFECVTTFQTWNQGMTWSSSADDETEESSRTNGQIPPSTYKLQEPGIPFNALQNSPEARAWFSTIPCDIVACVTLFEQRFPGTTFSLLWCISRSQHARELFQSTPILASIILHCAHQNQWLATDVLTLFSQKRKRILLVCGLPANNAFLKILSKLQQDTFNALDYEFLTNVNWTRSLKLLSHVELVDIRLIRFLSKFPVYNEASFLYQYQLNWSWMRVEMLIRDTQSMGEQLAVLNIAERIMRCKTLQALSALHEQMIKQLNERKMQSIPQYTFPPPPLPDSASIQAIQDNHALMQEGRSQHHCVASYERAIQAGEYYVYKVLTPERATLGLRIKKDSQIVIDQFLLACNASPSPETYDHINEWLNRVLA